ncbi:uncharacterized protein N7515_003833 [Penicillium bovifimosum]|uniref:Uncharacterized protein n=1 Tax=Penicillium bovifimosum TaxID=126998 RepID=A0A9W9H5F4_9EURO|nr:uncharacterized protein N7515_003833 [Penicillium bovifimosum]KAJ5138985.1 hypothetical protein N7515_003833 [Penicillium bovifimosum]
MSSSPEPRTPWFHQGTDPITIITLDQPIPSRWKILSKLNEHDHQGTEETRGRHDHYSYATLKLLCCDPKKPSNQAFMRIYLQVPTRNTEMQGPQTRSRQATKFTPPELTAYQELTRQDFRHVPKLLGYKVSTQDKSGLVPGGYAIWLVWEKVPGLRLAESSNRLANHAYWTLSAVERERIRQAFIEVLPLAYVNGYKPWAPGLSNLVWHSESGTLYFIGIHGLMEKRTDRSKFRVGPQMLACFGLVKPSSKAWLQNDWNGDTTGWER